VADGKAFRVIVVFIVMLRQIALGRLATLLGVTFLANTIPKGECAREIALQGFAGSAAERMGMQCA